MAGRAAPILGVMNTTPDLSAFWMPFTANRYFKRHPTLVSGAQGAYFTLADGRRVFDCLSGLWCTPLGHGRPEIIEAVRRQIGELDFAPTFQVGHPKVFELAARVAHWAPEGLNRVFFTNSGSEAVDSALKIALAYHHARGEAGRVRIIGRERAYHGVGIGGISAGGIGSNRRVFGALSAPFVDHLPHTYDPTHMRFTRGQPAWGAHLADTLERLVALHDASTIAAVIVEPMQGSTGVIVPPVGYLERLREICTRHGILLIFDEVITGFGRVGTPFAAQRLGVRPDLLTFAKAVTNGVIPLGGVIAHQSVYDALMRGPEQTIELFHGYTYSGHPVACAAGSAVFEVIGRERLWERAATAGDQLREGILGLAQRGLPVSEVRGRGLLLGVGLDRPIAALAAQEALSEGVLVNAIGDRTIRLAPPLVISDDEVELAVARLAKALERAGDGG